MPVTKKWLYRVQVLKDGLEDIAFDTDPGAGQGAPGSRSAYGLRDAMRLASRALDEFAPVREGADEAMFMRGVPGLRVSLSNSDGRARRHFVFVRGGVEYHAFVLLFRPDVYRPAGMPSPAARRVAALDEALRALEAKPASMSWQRPEREAEVSALRARLDAARVDEEAQYGAEFRASVAAEVRASVEAEVRASVEAAFRASVEAAFRARLGELRASVEAAFRASVEAAFRARLREIVDSITMQGMSR
jgi:hypothetical protein